MKFKDGQNMFALAILCGTLLGALFGVILGLIIKNTINNGFIIGIAFGTINGLVMGILLGREYLNYGDRLDNLVEVEKSTLTDMANKVKENESVKDVTSTASGRIINIIITVNDEVGLSAAKKIGESVKEFLTEENIANYDIQVFLKKESEAENDFPIIGYKAKERDNFSWVKDREKKSLEVEEEE